MPEAIAGEKTRLYQVFSGFFLFRLIKAAYKARAITREQRIDLCVSFNPFPHAVVA
jgi:hypothetical protein